MMTKDQFRGRDYRHREGKVPEELEEVMTEMNYLYLKSYSNNQRQYFRRGFLLDLFQ